MGQLEVVDKVMGAHLRGMNGVGISHLGTKGHPLHKEEEEPNAPKWLGRAKLTALRGPLDLIDT